MRVCIRLSYVEYVYTVVYTLLEWLRNIAFWVGFQGEWKLVALSAPYRLKRPDRRFEELKNYSSELQTHINNIVKIRTVSSTSSASWSYFLHHSSNSDQGSEEPGFKKSPTRVSFLGFIGFLDVQCQWLSYM